MSATRATRAPTGVEPGDHRIAVPLGTTDPGRGSIEVYAELLAHRAWTEPLYDPRRLAANAVPVAAWVYTQDMFVDPELSRRAAARAGAVRVIEDAARHHDGLRRSGAEVLCELHEVLGAPTVLEAAS
jgi:hypothetical protein